MWRGVTLKERKDHDPVADAYHGVERTLTILLPASLGHTRKFDTDDPQYFFFGTVSSNASFVLCCWPQTC